MQEILKKVLTLIKFLYIFIYFQIQGIAWTIFTIISILLYYQVFVHEPKYDSYSSILTSTIYILYFNNDLLSDFGATVDDILVTPNILVIFSWIYLFLSFIWFCWSCWQLWGETFAFLKKCLVIFDVDFSGFT